MDPIKTLVVGYGLSATAFHLPFLSTNPAFSVEGIVQARASTAREELPQLNHYRSLEEALTSSKAELVVVTAPNEFHAPMAKAALQAGKHVVIEKPFVIEVTEARELCTLAEKQNRVMTVFHNRRWDADFLTVKKALAEEIVGRPVFFLSRYDRFRPKIKQDWKEEAKPGAGIFYNLGPHLIDQALQLFGWPAELYAHLRQERKGTVTPDAFDLFLYYPELTVHLTAGSLVSAPFPRYSLLGTAGSYTKWGLDPQEDELRNGTLPTRANWGEEPPEAWGTLITGKEGSTKSQSYPSEAGNYGAFFNELAAAIRQDGKNPVSPKEALQVMQIIELAHKSHAEGRRIAAGAE